MRGYTKEDYALEFMSLTGRWTDKEKQKGYWVPLAQIEASIESNTLKLQSMRTPDSNSQYANMAIQNANQAMSYTSNNIAMLKGIVSRVISLIYEFAIDVYYKKQFKFTAESIFEKYKNELDEKLYSTSKEIVEKIPAIIDRLNNGDIEAISNSLTSCRRLINNFADFVFPATNSEIELDGNKVSVKQDKVLNRINAYVHKKTKSKSRKKRIRQNLSNLYDRVSAGVHSDLDLTEARALFFNVYLILGEILTIE